MDTLVLSRRRDVDQRSWSSLTGELCNAPPPVRDGLIGAVELDACRCNEVPRERAVTLVSGREVGKIDGVAGLQGALEIGPSECSLDRLSGPDELSAGIVLEEQDEPSPTLEKAGGRTQLGAGDGYTSSVSGRRQYRSPFCWMKTSSVSSR